MVAISPDSPARLSKSLEVQDLGYTLYSDSPLEAARAFGIVFQLSDEEVSRYREYGIDLEAASGHSHHLLPVPSVFLFAACGMFSWVYSNPDYRVRPDNSNLLEAAQNLAAHDPE